MSFSINVQGLTEREAIADAIYRGTAAFDTNDYDLLKSAFLKDGAFEMFGNVSSGHEQIKSQVLDLAGPLETTHFVSNVRVDHKAGADTAHMTCYVQAQHFKPGEGLDPSTKNLLSGSQYFMDLQKDTDGLWKFKKCLMKTIWLQGDTSIVGQ